MRIFVCFVVMLFVDVCHQWACKLEDMKLLVRLVQDGDVRLEVGYEDLYNIIPGVESSRSAE